MLCCIKDGLLSGGGLTVSNDKQKKNPFTRKGSVSVPHWRAGKQKGKNLERGKDQKTESSR